MIKYLKEGQFYLFLFPTLFVGNHLFTIISPPNDYSSILDCFLWVSTLICAIAFCCLPVVTLYWLLRLKVDKIKSGIVATLIFLPILFYQESFMLISFLLNGNVRFRWLLSGIFVMTGLSIFLVFSSKKSLVLLNELLNITSLCLVGFIFGSIALSFNEIRPKRLNFETATLELKCSSCPDIYFFLLDGYTSNKSLEDYFNFQNSDFTNKLRNRGFFVSDQALSSYNKTVYSLGATLNLDTIQDLDSFYEKDMLGLIQDNTVAKSLAATGYEIFNFSWFDILNESSFYSLEKKIKWEFVNGVFQNSIFRFLDGSENNPGNFSKFYDINTTILSEVKKASKRKRVKPAFFYAHILAPHPPFVIGPEGQRIGLLDQPPTQVEAYVDQVKGLNKLTYLALSEILGNSQNSVIIIQGDHGSRLLSGKNKAKESFTVFFAHYGLLTNATDSVSQSNKIFKIVFQNLNKN